MQARESSPLLSTFFGYDPKLMKFGRHVEVESLIDAAILSQKRTISAGYTGSDERKDKNFKFCWYIIIDIDGKTSSKQAIKKLNLLGCNFAITFTMSHLDKSSKNPKGEERFRILIPLQRPIETKNEYKKWYKMFCSLLPGTDPSCSTPTKIYYPSSGTDERYNNNMYVVDEKENF